MNKNKQIEMAGPNITKVDEKFILDAFRNGWYGKNKFYYVEKFEKEFAKYHNRKYGLMTPNCTTAIHLILHSLGIKKGDNVANQECTWVAAAAAVSYTNAKNNFIDICEKDWCMSPKDLEEKINKKTKAIIVSDIYGNMPDMNKICMISKKYKIPLIEDSAEALGSKYRNKQAGSFGIASTFSFHRTKTITTGEGGMIVTDDKNLFEKCKFFRDQGRNFNKSYIIDKLGFKYMPFNMQAALGFAQFKRIKKIIKIKRDIFFKFKKYLSCLDDLSFNNDDKITYNGCWATTLVIGQSYKIDANELMKKLNELGLPTRPFFAPLSSMKPFFDKASTMKNKNAYTIYKRGLTLPSALNLEDSQIKFYADAIISILKDEKK